LAALDRLDAEYGPQSSGNHDVSAKSSESVDLQFAESRPPLASAVRAVIESFGEATFSKGDVLEKLKEMYPLTIFNEGSVAAYLARQGKNEKKPGGLTIVVRGNGTIPAKYQNPNAPIEL
jgi:hypothetical protein